MHTRFLLLRISFMLRRWQSHFLNWLLVPKRKRTATRVTVYRFELNPAAKVCERQIVLSADLPLPDAGYLQREVRARGGAGYYPLDYFNADGEIIGIGDLTIQNS